MLFLTDTFLFNYADNSNLYSIAKDDDATKKLLQKDFSALTERFFESSMVLNQKKCYYMCIGGKTEKGNFEFDNLLL